MPFMVWDLRGALLKKEEKESARLADFEFRHRARTFRLLARLIGEPEHYAVALITRGPDNRVLEELALRHPEHREALSALYDQCRTEARQQLIRERGNPASYRLL